MATAAKEMSFDEFEKYDPNAGGSKGGFFKWRDQNGGSAIVWLHSKRACFEFPNHNWPRIVEVRDKETNEKEQRVFSDRWGCLERQTVIESQYFRDKHTDVRKHPPELCPVCLLAEYCYQQIVGGAWNATKPVFKFEGSRRDEDVVLTAGGICRYFTDKRFEREPNLARELKAAHLNRDELWKQNLLTQKKFLFVVVDDAHPGEGLQTCFEGLALTKAIQKAMVDEKTKLQRLRKDPSLANPAVHPYRFEWSFDRTKNPNEMYRCVALRDDDGDVPEDVLELVTGELPDVAHLVAQGDCFAIRGQMEAHLCEGVEIPWEEIFGTAEAKGLMKPPEEARADADGADDEDPGAFFDRQAAASAGQPRDPGPELSPEARQFRKEVVLKLAAETPKSSSSDYAEAGLVDVVRVDVKSAIWKELVKPTATGRVLAQKFSELKGAEVLLDAPEGTSDADVARFTDLLTKAGASSVGELVPCEHCGAEMTTIDVECRGCGAQVTDDGKLASRPCLKCNAQVPLAQGGDVSFSGGVRSICPKCATVHDECAEREPVWIVVEPEPVPAQRRARRGSARGAPPFART